MKLDQNKQDEVMLEGHNRRLKQATAGCAESRRALLHEIQDDIYRFCFSQLNHHEEANDAMQETAYRVLKNWHKFQGQSSWRTWVLGIALNVCREFYRKSQRLIFNSEMIQEEMDEHKSNQNQTEEVSSLLVEAMQHLTLKQREVVTCRYLESMSVTETALLMDVAEGTVKATLAQALAKLKRYLR